MQRVLAVFLSLTAERDTVKTFLDGHLANVVSRFKSYIPEVREKSEQLDWVRNPFTLSQSNRGTLPVHLREEILDLSTDRGLQITFAHCSLTEFRVCEESIPSEGKGLRNIYSHLALPTSVKPPFQQ